MSDLVGKYEHSFPCDKAQYIDYSGLDYSYYITETSPNKSDPRFPPNIIVKMGEVWGRNQNDKWIIRTHLAYIDKVKKSCYIKQQFTVLKALAS